jgi:hypothetical protein
MAEIYYRNGVSTQIVTFEELAERQEIVELGPDWNGLEKIEIHLNRPSRDPSPEPVRKTKNIFKPHRKQQWVIPPDASAAFVASMEDVLEVYLLS